MTDLRGARRSGLLFEAEDGRTRFLVEAGSPPVVVGRSPPRDPRSVRLRTILASRQHVRIHADGDGFAVEDAGSTGGAYLDGLLVRGRQPIGPGMRLRLAADADFTTRGFRGASLYDRVTAAAGPIVDAHGGAALIGDLLRALRPLHATDEAHGNLDWHHVVGDEVGWTVLIDGWTVLDLDGTLNCNPAYCAPEVFSGNVLVPSSDLYAVGLLAFEARFGHRPFDDDDSGVQQHMLRKLVGAPTWRGEVAADERDLYLSLLAREPHQRPAIGRCLERVYELYPDLRSRDRDRPT